MLNVLVTGADGFVGRAVVRRLLDDGREVTGAVRPGKAATAGAERMNSPPHPPARANQRTQIIRRIHPAFPAGD